jgi:hypothetical protein
MGGSTLKAAAMLVLVLFAGQLLMAAPAAAEYIYIATRGSL